MRHKPSEPMPRSGLSSLANPKAALMASAPRTPELLSEGALELNELQHQRPDLHLLPRSLLLPGAYAHIRNPLKILQEPYAAEFRVLTCIYICTCMCVYIYTHTNL